MVCVEDAQDTAAVILAEARFNQGVVGVVFEDEAAGSFFSDEDDLGRSVPIEELNFASAVTFPFSLLA